jgi:glycosyltransferase involved in cell wall biosynthesis
VVRLECKILTRKLGALKLTKKTDSDTKSIRVLMLSSSPHPFVEELRNHLNRNGIETEAIYQPYPWNIRSILHCLKFSACMLLFLGKLIIINMAMLSKLIKIIFKIKLTKLLSKRVLYIPFIILFASMAYKLYRQRPFDLIHAHFSYPAGASAVLVKSITGTPVIISVLGYDADDFTMKDTFFMALSKFAIDNADAVIATAENLHRNLLLIGINEKENSIYYIPVAVDTKKFSPNVDGTFIRRKYGIDNKKVVIGFGPHLQDLYGPFDFLRAGVIISKKLPDVFLILMGDGPLLNHLKSFGKKWNLNVIFTGRIPYDEIPYYYAALDIFCTPSYAGQGVSCLEAMASGKPVVGYNIGTIKIFDGENGFLVYPGDIEKLAERLLNLIEDLDLRRKMGENARKTVLLQYDIVNITKQIKEVYYKVLSKKLKINSG